MTLQLGQARLVQLACLLAAMAQPWLQLVRMWMVLLQLAPQPSRPAGCCCWLQLAQLKIQLQTPLQLSAAAQPAQPVPPQPRLPPCARPPLAACPLPLPAQPSQAPRQHAPRPPAPADAVARSRLGLACRSPEQAVAWGTQALEAWRSRSQKPPANIRSRVETLAGRVSAQSNHLCCTYSPLVHIWPRLRLHALRADVCTRICGFRNVCAPRTCGLSYWDNSRYKDQEMPAIPMTYGHKTWQPPQAQSSTEPRGQPGSLSVDILG